MEHSLYKIRPALQADVKTMVTLSRQKRQSYARAQPQFWRPALNADKIQTRWFESLLSHPDYLLLIGEREDQIRGFIIGRLMTAPEIYEPGGLTLMIDDFCVEKQELGSSLGGEMIEKIREMAKQKEVVQVLVVCGHHDEPKHQFLKNMGLSIVSEWYRKAI